MANASVSRDNLVAGIFFSVALYVSYLRVFVGRKEEMGQPVIHENDAHEIMESVAAGGGLFNKDCRHVTAQIVK